MVILILHTLPVHLFHPLSFVVMKMNPYEDDLLIVRSLLGQIQKNLYVSQRENIVFILIKTHFRV